MCALYAGVIGRGTGHLVLAAVLARPVLSAGGRGPGQRVGAAGLADAKALLLHS